MTEQEWNLPVPERIETIRLLPLELLLIDWILCTGSSLLQLPMDELRDEWHMFRASVWAAYFESDQSGVMVHLSEYEAKTLLVACPTTFSWGDGKDYGLSLKEKLAKMLLGTYTDPALTARIDAERIAKENAKLTAENKLKTATTNLSTAEKAQVISQSALETKETEAERLRKDTVSNARAAVQTTAVAIDKARGDLQTAILEAKEYDIYPDENQASN